MATGPTEGTIPPPFLGSVREERTQVGPFKGSTREGLWRQEAEALRPPILPELAQAGPPPQRAAPFAPVMEEDIARHEAEAAATGGIKPEDVPTEATRRILSEHSTRLSPEDKRVTLRVNPDTGSQRITGSHFIEGDPVHERPHCGKPIELDSVLAALSNSDLARAMRERRKNNLTPEAASEMGKKSAAKQWPKKPPPKSRTNG
jgi:hypothetical protein